MRNTRLAAGYQEQLLHLIGHKTSWWCSCQCRTHRSRGGASNQSSARPQSSFSLRSVCQNMRLLHTPDELRVGLAKALEAWPAMSGEESSIDLSFLSEGLSDGEADAVASAPASQPSSNNQAATQQRKRQRVADGDASEPPGSHSNGEQDDEQHQEQYQKQQLAEAQRKRKKVLTAAKVQRMRAASERRGIVYVSRIPPHMKPAKLRQMLSAYGEVGRVYCAAEDATVRRQRKQKGGNTGKNYVEGWVEFEDKAVAKRVAAMLNGQTMGGRRRSAYHYDIWCLKYLPKFKWDHLTEEIAYEKAVREQRLAAELAAAKRERDFYLSRVDRAKAEESMAERAAKKAMASADGPGAGNQVQSQEQAEAGGDAAGGMDGGSKKSRSARRHYGQRRPKADPVEAGTELSADVLSLVVRGNSKQQPEQ